jgi:lysophospholipase L1-like esterase
MIHLRRFASVVVPSTLLLTGLILRGYSAVPPVTSKGYDPDSKGKSNLVIAVLGSSTTSGAGARPISMSWANRYATYLACESPTNRLVNLARGGYTTYHILPTGSVPPPNRPQPDESRNITFALAQKPSAIIISMPSNDVALSYSLDETKRNLQTIAALVKAAGVPLWVTTSQPRGLSAPKREQLAAYRDYVNAEFGDKAIDFWNGMAERDGNLAPLYDSGDHTHLTNVGHALLFRRVYEKFIPDVLSSLTETATAVH